ncbi:MAG: RidA family protein [Burkholderiaceae bacterium]
MPHTIVSTPEAPSAIGPYSQAMRAGNTVYLSGQIALDPASGEVVAGGLAEQAERAFNNLAAVARAAGGSLADCVKLTLYLTDLGQFGAVNEIMARHFAQPYPARSTVEVSALPKGVLFEVDAIMVLP